MSLKQQVPNELNQADVETINKALDMIQAAIAGKTFTLTAEEHPQAGSSNGQNKLVVDRLNEIHNSHPHWDCVQVDWAAFEARVASSAALEKIIRRLQALTVQFDNTKLLYDDENYQQALYQYQFIGFLAEHKEPGAATILEDITRLLPGNRDEM